MKKVTLLTLLLLPLAGCANKPWMLPLAKTSDEAKAAVAFCDVAKQSWGSPVKGDPTRTQAQKAAYNAAGSALRCWGS